MNGNEAVYANVLGGLLTLAFLAWAGVVWRASAKAFELANNISIKVNTTLDLTVDRLEQLEKRMTAHEQLRGHPGDVADMEAVRREVDSLRARHVEDVAGIHAHMAEINRNNNHGA